MKNLLLGWCLIPIMSFCQTSQNVKVIYAVERTESLDLNKMTNNTAREILSSRLALLPEIEYELQACDGDYVFSFKEKLEINKQLSKTALLTGGSYIFFKYDTLRVKQTKSFGSKLNIYIPDDYYENWQITYEKKSILGFECYKAITYKEIITKDLERTNQLITAWFTPEINIQAGPQGLDNLPGLVLEGSINGMYNFVAKAINDEGCSSMKVPDGGKFISEEAYQKMISEILKDIKNRG